MVKDKLRSANGQRFKASRSLVAFLGSVSAISSILLLTGCIELPNQAQGPLSIRVSDGELQVAVCKSIVTNEVFATSHGNNQAAEFWRFNSNNGESVELSPGSILTAPSLKSLLGRTVTDAQPRVFKQNWYITVVVISSASSEKNFVAAFDLEKSQLPSDSWLHPDGHTTARPCW